MKELRLKEEKQNEGVSELRARVLAGTQYPVLKPCRETSAGYHGGEGKRLR